MNSTINTPLLHHALHALFDFHLATKYDLVKEKMSQCDVHFDLLEEESKYTFAKYVELFLLLSGVVTFFAPEQIDKLYCTDNLAYKDSSTKARIRHIDRKSALTMVGASLSWFMDVEHRIPCEKVVGFSSIPWFLYSLIILYTRDNNGVVTLDDKLFTVGFGLVIFAAFSELPNLKIVGKCFTSWMLLKGLSFFLKRQQPDGKKGSEKIISIAEQLLGYNITTWYIFFCARLWGVKDLHALGISWGAVFLGMILLTRTFRNYVERATMTPFFVWIAFMGGVAFVLLK